DHGVERRLGEIVAETARQVCDSTFQRHQTVMQGLFVSRGRRGLGDEWLHAKQDLAVIRVAAVLRHALFHVGVIGCSTLHKRLNSKNDLSMFGCKVPSSSR